MPRAMPAAAEHGPEVARFRQHQRAVPMGRDRQQRALAFQVAGEEDHQADLGGLAGLEPDGPDADPQLRPVDALPEDRHQGQQEQHDGEQPDGVVVPGQAAGGPHDQQRDRERDQAHEGPRDLGGGDLVGRVGEVDPSDEHQPEPVEQEGGGQDDGVGVRGGAANEQVGRGGGDRHRQPVGPGAGGNVRGLGPAEDRVGGHRQQDGTGQQPPFGGGGGRVGEQLVAHGCSSELYRR